MVVLQCQQKAFILKPSFIFAFMEGGLNGHKIDPSYPLSIRLSLAHQKSPADAIGT
jgi:hypothetical protein